uniref:Uncharacterized protein n=1 Tax=Saccharolobus islandicus TaxID=43080 RepID=Q5W2Z1_SACIS|nr:hypothetical protein [Sulfolobus islandicus]CAG38155.1 hypothetical protein [Sulfolobus islandicus]
MSQNLNPGDVGKKIADLFENPEKYHHPIKWYVNVTKVGKYKYSLGYCVYGKGTAFVAADGLTPLVVADVIVVGNDCSDAKWCINLACPLNRTNIEYLRKYGIRNKEDLQKFYEKIKEVEKKLDEIGLGFEKAKPGINLFKKPIIRIEKKR